MSIVLGLDNARVIATLANRTFTYELELTNLNGRQIETYEVSKVRHVLQSLDIASPSKEITELVEGYRIYWDLSYNTFIDGDDVMNLIAITTRYKQGYTLTLIPRVDQPQRRFEVIPDNESLSLGINKGGYKGFNTDFNYKFVTKDLVQDLQIQIAIDPASFTYGRIFSAGVLKGRVQ